MRAVGSIALSLACGALVAGCGFKDMAAGRGEAQKAVAEFHALENDGRFTEIYDGASDDFRRAGGRERFVELLGAVQRKLGKVTGTDNRGWRVNTWNLTTYVEVGQATHFERGNAQESFRFVIRGGKAALIAYNIQSDELITR